MSEALFYVYVAGSLVVIVGLIYIFVIARSSSDNAPRTANRRQAAASSQNEDDSNVMRIGNRVIRNRHSRQAAAPRRQAAAQQQHEFEEEHDEVAAAAPRQLDAQSRGQQQPDNDSDFSVTDSEDESDHEQFAGQVPAAHHPSPTFSAKPSGKIGKKKQLKLEMKAEKRAARERELLEREERRQKEEKENELRRKKEEEREQRERDKEEAERKAKEEQERKEYEEYLKLKQSFQVEDEGFDANIDETDAQNLLIEFINTIKEKKIVLLEELAAEFKMRTQDVIDRLNNLLASGELTGVIDDRGKFIYITEDELKSVAKFIRQRGRVSITDLVENSRNLIKL